MSNKTKINKTTNNEINTNTIAPITGINLQTQEDEKRLARMEQQLILERESIAAAKKARYDALVTLANALPGQFGCADLASTVQFLRKINKGQNHKTGVGRKSKITEEIKSGIVQMVKDRFTGQQIAEKFGVSVPSIMKVKAEFNLVRSHKKTAVVA
jgi:hypothetical protein